MTPAPTSGRNVQRDPWRGLGMGWQLSMGRRTSSEAATSGVATEETCSRFVVHFHDNFQGAHVHF